MKLYKPALLAVMSAAPFVAADPQANVIRMTVDNVFDPKTITIKSGETVVWKNVSDLPHTVTAMSGIAATADDASLPPNAQEFNSGVIPKGKDFSHTFTVPGTYKYFCIPHEHLGMVGTVVVSK
jgi:plastocyanin